MKKLAIFLSLIIFFLIVFFLQNNKADTNLASTAPKEVESSGRTKVHYPQDYTIVLVGDSMTAILGNSDELRDYLSQFYPGKTFEVLNYGFGSTNILSVQKRLNEETFYGRVFRPILDIDFDLIIIESFGHNPLSEYSLDEGLSKQNSALDQIIKDIQESNPEAKVILLATISPNKRMYGTGQVDLSDEQRERWAGERIVYIKNHIKYGNDHNIGVINVYEKSLDESGDGNTDYINNTDFIHPSPKGVYLISESISKFIFENKLLPQ